MDDEAARIGARLEAWLPKRLNGMAPIRIASLCRAEGGRSSETWLVDAVMAKAPELQRWVLRIQPTARQVYEDPSVARQFSLISALSASGGIPVPKAIALEEDADVLGAPFFLMVRANGVAPPNAYHSTGVLVEATPSAREALWAGAVTMLASLHRAGEAADTGFLAFPPAQTEDGSGQELARWDSFRTWSGIAQLPLYDEVRCWLDGHRPWQVPAAFAWGDARPCNMLFERGACTALLDWETASLGGPESDLGWWLAYDRMVTDVVGVPRLAGLPDAEATIALWEAESGRRAQHMTWHAIFATWRFALISERAMLLAVRAGHLPNRAPGDGNPAVRLLGILLAEVV